MGVHTRRRRPLVPAPPVWEQRKEKEKDKEYKCKKKSKMKQRMSKGRCMGTAPRGVT